MTKEEFLEKVYPKNTETHQVTPEEQLATVIELFAEHLEDHENHEE